MFRNTLKLLVVCSVACGAHAQLDPPVGPIVKTGKLLTEIEPRTAINATNTPGDAGSIYIISQPGSYYLTGNVNATLFTTKNGITIAADNVTIDMMGFSLTGVSSAGSGIIAAVGNNPRNTTVKNGKITGWGRSGIILAYGPNTQGINTIVENVHASENTEYGIYTGRRSLVKNCIAESNGAAGIYANDGVVEGCVSASGGSVGIQAGVVTDCTTEQNISHGIVVFGGGTATGCKSSNNGENGVYLLGGATITDCAVTGNNEIGIEALSGCHISNNTVTTSGFDNISVTDLCVVRSNTSTFAGTLPNGANSVGAGILVTGSDNRIEDNNCTASDWGIRVTADGNFIARNTCSGNTTLNWSVVANNQCLVVLGLNAGAISGDSGGTSPGSTNPNANYTY